MKVTSLTEPLDLKEKVRIFHVLDVFIMSWSSQG